MKATVASLHCYPLKSARGVDLTEAIIGARGFHLDRHWMLIDGESCFVSQRQVPALARLFVRLGKDHLEISWPDKSPFAVPHTAPAGVPFPATMHSSQKPLLVVDEGPAASDWLTDCIGERKGQRLRLVRLAPGYVRGVPDEGGRIALEMLKPCKRCGTPQVNQETGERDLGSSLHDALTELCGRLPVADNFFGQNAVVDSGVGEILEVGQRLAIERAP